MLVACPVEKEGGGEREKKGEVLVGVRVDGSLSLEGEGTAGG